MKPFWMPMPSFYHGSKILKNEHIAKCFIINIFSHSTATLFSARCEPIYIYIGLHLALTETVCGIAPMTTFTNNILLPKTYISHFPIMANHLEPYNICIIRKALLKKSCRCLWKGFLETFMLFKISFIQALPIDYLLFVNMLKVN